MTYHLSFQEQQTPLVVLDVYFFFLLSINHDLSKNWAQAGPLKMWSPLSYTLLFMLWVIRSNLAGNLPDWLTTWKKDFSACIQKVGLEQLHYIGGWNATETVNIFEKRNVPGGMTLLTDIKVLWKTVQIWVIRFWRIGLWCWATQSKSGLG